jgi:hypothetical protein
LWQFLAELFIRIKNISDKTFVEKIKTRILSSVFFFSRQSSDNVEKYTEAGQTTDDNMANAHCTLDT